MTVLLSTILTLSVLGILAAVILYFVAQKFKVEEDPRIDEVEKMLPGANCGGCGFAGCRAMAEAMVVREDISALFCPVGGAECMKKMAAYLGKVAPEKEPTVATVRCGGVCGKRPRTNEYNATTGTDYTIANLRSYYVGPGKVYYLMEPGTWVAAMWGMTTEGEVTGLYAASEPITITDPNMTRFLMNLDEAVDLVLFAFENGLLPKNPR